MIDKTRIGARLFAGFSILVLFSLGYAVYSILQMASLHPSPSRCIAPPSR